MAPSTSSKLPRLLVHATTVALGPVAAILRGPSGAGKSDLALRFLAATGPGNGRTLVADDQTIVTLQDGLLIATAPATIAGQIEVRGVGIIAMPTIASAEVRIVVDLVSSAEVERLPSTATTTDLLGQTVSLNRLAPFEASAPLKLALMLAAATEPRT